MRKRQTHRRANRLRRIGFTLIEVAIGVAILAALTGITAAVISRNAQPTADNVTEYRDDTQSAWSSVDGFRITCPPGISAEEGNCTEAQG